MENRNLPEKKKVKNKKLSKYISIAFVIFALIYNVSPVDWGLFRTFEL